MEQNDEFIRVGTTYYKIVDQPLVNGETVKRRIPWSIEALRQDYGKNFIADIPKFDGFCTVPNHLDYNRERSVPSYQIADGTHFRRTV